MLYLWLKYIHILSSTILFGTGIGTACVMLYGHVRKNMDVRAGINQYVVFVDWLFTGISGVLQPITGFWMVYLAGYPLTSLWLMGSILGYVITAFCWFPVVYLQIKISRMTTYAAQTHSLLPPTYYYYFKIWIVLGCIAFVSLLVVFYLMVMKPF